MSRPSPDGCKLGLVQGLEIPLSRLSGTGRGRFCKWYGFKMPLQLVPVESSASESDFILIAPFTNAP